MKKACLTLGALAAVAALFLGGTLFIPPAVEVTKPVPVAEAPLPPSVPLPEAAQKRPAEAPVLLPPTVDTLVLNPPTVLAVQPVEVVKADVKIPESPKPENVPVDKPTPEAKPKRGPAFANYPVDQTKSVEFGMDDGTRSRLTPRERLDQLRDWSLMAVMADSGLTADELNRALFDVPTVRHGYFRSATNFEYGPTRSAVLGNGEVVAILPRASTEEKRDYLAHITDDFRKSTGQKPAKVLVFETELDVPGLRGKITRRPDVAGDTLFTGDFGYSEVTIADARELEKFLVSAPDLTFAELDGARLRVGGRRLSAQAVRGIRIMDVAALWQAEHKLAEAMRTAEAKFAREHDDLKAEWQRKLDNRRLNGLTQEQIQAGYDAAARELARSQGKRYRELGLVAHAGFSLDPTLDFDAILADFEENAAKSLAELAKDPKSGITGAFIDGLRKALKNRDEDTLYQCVRDLLKGTDPDKIELDNLGPMLVGSQLQMAMQEKRFQAARYDGDLQGTEVGMVLFYTDLLAKLWALDYQDDTPRTIEDFKSLIAVPISPIYREEIRKLSGTRLWFGLEDKGFQLANGGKSLLLSRIATRIFAKSAENLSPKDEKSANAQSEAFLGWWNEHYEEVARFEPEYQRLNEIMKWSVVLNWLSHHKSFDRLSFLNRVDVDHSAWFPDWVQKKPELKFSKWDKIGFEKRGYKGTKTEAMPILVSKEYDAFGDGGRMSGGVSLAEKKTIAERMPLRDGLDQMSLRGVDPATLKGGSFESVRGTKYEMLPAREDGSALRATPKEGSRLRATHSEIGAGTPREPTRFERSLDRPEGGGIRVHPTVGGVDLASLVVRPPSEGKSAFVGLRSGPMEKATDVGRSLSVTRDPARSLAANPDVKSVVEVKPGEFVAELVGSGQVVRLQIERRPSDVVPAGFHSRTADNLQPNAKVVNIAFVDGWKSVQPELAKAEYLRVDLPVAVGGASGPPMPPRGPPHVGLAAEPPPPGGGGRKFTVDFAGVVLKGVASAEGRLHIETASVAKAGVSPERVGELFSPKRVDGLMAEVRKPGIGEARYEDGNRLHSEHPAWKAAEVGDVAGLAKAIAADPVAAKEVLASHKAKGLDEARALIDEGRPNDAGKRLEQLAMIHPKDADIAFLRAVADLGGPRHSEAVRRLSDSPARGPPTRDLEFVCNELNARRGEPGRSAEGKKVLEALPTPRAMKGGKTGIAEGPAGKLETFAEVESMPLTAVKPETIPEKGPMVVYTVEGTPLNLGDNPRRAINEVVAGERGELHRLYADKAPPMPAAEPGKPPVKTPAEVRFDTPQGELYWSLSRSPPQVVIRKEAGKEVRYVRIDSPGAVYLKPYYRPLVCPGSDDDDCPPVYFVKPGQKADRPK